MQYGKEPDAATRAKWGTKKRSASTVAGTNCIKICLPGKLILSKRKGLLEVLFS